MVKMSTQRTRSPAAQRPVAPSSLIPHPSPISPPRPEVARPRPFAIALALLLTLLPPPALARPPAPVVTAEVERGTAGTGREVVGSIVAERSVAVAAEVAGAVEAVVARRGQPVAEGDALVRLRTRPLELQLDEARARLAEVEAQLTRASADATRTEHLFARTLVAQEQVDAARAGRDTLTHRRDAARAQIALLEDRLARAVVRAPFAGRVVAERTEVGAWVALGDPVAEVVQLDRVRARLGVPEDTLRHLHLGDTVPITVPAAGPGPRTGPVVAIVPRGDPEARTFPVEVALENPDGRLLPGMAARALLPGEAIRDALLVPKDAVISGRRGATVVRVVDGVAEVVAVEVIGTQGSLLAVRSAGTTLVPGDRVVVRGNERLRPGQRVAERAAASAHPPLPEAGAP